MPDDRTHDADQLFLARVEEQDRFREVLRYILREGSVVERVKDWIAEQTPDSIPFVFLLYGEGGMGKSSLARRMRDIALNEAEFKDRFQPIWLDWETRKGMDFKLVARDNVSPETVFEHIYAVFRDAGFGKEFDPYEKAVKTRAEAEKKVAQALDAAGGEGRDRYAGLRELGGKGLAWLLRAGLPVAGPHIPQEPAAKAFEAILGGGAEAIARARETATTLVRARLDADEFDLFTLPNETLARRLADGIQAAARRKPIVLTLDTYEIADRADAPWLRVVIKRAGPRVIWVIAGRDNLADSRKFGMGYQTGYRADFPSDRLRVFPLNELSVGDVADYFQQCVPTRPLDPSGASAIHRATLGIPLAVHEAAAIWANPHKTLNDITGDDAPSRDRDEIVKKMTERFLLHCWDDPKDKARLYALALAYHPDADLLSAMLETQDLETDLSELERRHSFVFVTEMKLHDKVGTLIREYLLAEVRRKSKDVRQAHERAAQHLRARLIEREKLLPTLEDRVGDERWTADTAALTHHAFWLDEDQGWAALLPAFVGGLAYDRDFARALLDAAEPLARILTKSGQRRLKTLQAGLGPQPDVEQEAALAAELEATQRIWPDDGCAGERRAILDLRRGQLLYRREKYSEALSQFEQAERGLPEQGDALRNQLGKMISDVASKIMMAGRRFIVVGKPDKAIEDAIKIYRHAIQLNTKDAVLHNDLGKAYFMVGRFDEAASAYRDAIELDPTSAAPYDLLGELYGLLGRDDDAIAAFQTAISLDPRYALSFHNLGIVYRSQSRYEDALAAFKSAIEFDPTNFASHNFLGDVYSKLGRYDEAIAAYQYAIELGPKYYATPHNGLGNVYRALGRHDEAITAYQHAIELDPKNAHPHYILGSVYLSLGRHDEAIAAYQSAIELDPKFAAAQASLAACYRRLGRETEYAEQIKIARELIAKENEYSRACFESICGNVDEALALLKVALEKKQVPLAWARRDPDFDFIRDDPRFKALVGEG